MHASEKALTVPAALTGRPRSGGYHWCPLLMKLTSGFTRATDLINFIHTVLYYCVKNIYFAIFYLYNLISTMSAEDPHRNELTAAWTPDGALKE